MELPSRATGIRFLTPPVDCRLLWPGVNAYDIYFSASTDGGTTWNNRYVLATTSFSSATDPLPVIQANVKRDPWIMVVFRNGSSGSGGLTSYRTTTSNPTSPANWTAVQLPGTGSTHFWPAIAGVQNYWGQSTNFGVAYARSDGKVFFNYYQPAGSGWGPATGLSAIVPGSRFHQTPSLAGTPNSTMWHAAWHANFSTGSGPYDQAILYRRSSGLSSWSNQYTEFYYDRYRPSVTAVSASTADLVFQAFSGDLVYREKKSGLCLMAASRPGCTAWSGTVATSLAKPWPAGFMWNGWWLEPPPPGAQRG